MYQQYKRRAPRKRTRDYFMPFFIILIILAIIIFGWRTLNKVLINENRNTFTEKVFLNIENGSAKAMTVGKSEWKNVPDAINLYSGEKLKTGPDGRATLTFSDKSIIRLDRSTEVELIQLKKKNDINTIKIALKKGKIWSKIETINNPDSSFEINSDLVTIDSKGGNIAVSSPATVYVIDGSAQVNIKYNDEIIKTVNVGVGQQFDINSEKISRLNEGLEVELIYALSDSFKTSVWYRWNAKKDGAITAFEESDDTVVNEEEITDEIDNSDNISDDEVVNVDRLISIIKPSQNSSTNKSIISLSGVYDSDSVKSVYIHGKKANITGVNKWQINEVKLAIEGKNNLKVEAENAEGVKTELEDFVITYDNTAPSMPQISDPGSNDDTITIQDIEQIITGTVSKDTYAVIVNDYKLSKYVPGSKKFEYYAKTAYGNLEVGDNEYIVYAEDKAGNQSKPATITLTLEQEVIDDSVETTEDESSDSDSEESLTSLSEGGVTITSPNNGKSFSTSDTEFEIKGAVPVGTAKVEVNNYTLGLFKEGDSTYKYSAKSSFKNLIIGKKNTYTVKAFDKNSKLLGSATITIDVQSGTSPSPVITMPSTSGKYSTTLNELVVGGTVGKWIQNVYINGEKLSSYTPGSEKWSKTINLESGDNVFTVEGEKDGVRTPSTSITIKY